MPRPPRRWSPVALALLASACLAPAFCLADDPPAPQPNPEPWKLAKEIKPLPLVAIPDDPPPHEGAMFDLPYIIEPPDIITVEVLEALPGRPVTGERLVRPDGMISLGFYGEIAVRGLTIEQVKTKVVRTMQEHLSDETLGLFRMRIEQGQPALEIVPLPVPKPGDQAPDLPGGVKPASPAEEIPPGEATPTGRAKPARTTATRKPRRPPHPLRRAKVVSQAPAVKPGGDAKIPTQQDPEIMRDAEQRPPTIEAVEPANTLRIFVDINSYNSKVYFVQGDVGTPGRLPFTGGETILDAVNYAGGLTSTAEPKNVHLYRPARAGKPARDYSIDWEAIQKGDAVANLQVFPNDRIVVGRNVIVQKTIEIDRAAAPINSIFNNLIQRSFTTQSMGAATGVIGLSNEPQRDADLKAWSEFLWGLSSKEGGAMLDDKAFREAVMQRLGPIPAPK